MAFLDIAYQADISRYEDSDFEEYSRRNCNEDPETRAKIIDDLRRMIAEKGECVPRRLDDAYLLRFLRCRRFIPALSHRLLVRYEKFRRDNPSLYNCDAFGLKKVVDVFGGTLPESPVTGRILIMRIGKWDPNTTPAEDIIRCALLMDELAVMQPKLQILGVSIIMDLEGVSVWHARHFSPTLANQVVSLMGVNFPLHLHGLHVINYSWILNSLYYLFKQFIPKNAWGRIHFHSNMASLHKLIHPECLPPDYEGCCRHVIKFEEWITKIDQYKDDFMVEELRDLGYYVK